MVSVPRIGTEAREERRQELIDAAWRCVARSGYHNLTIDDVCVEANLSKGAFYTYFKQKLDLLVALLDEDAASLEDLITDLGEAHASGIELSSLSAGRAGARRGPRRSPDAGRPLGGGARRPEVQQRFAATVRQRRAMLVEWIGEAIGSGENRRHSRQRVSRQSPAGPRRWAHAAQLDRPRRLPMGRHSEPPSAYCSRTSGTTSRGDRKIVVGSPIVGRCTGDRAHGPGTWLRYRNSGRPLRTVAQGPGAPEPHDGS